jgi:hypothetical protein
VFSVIRRWGVPLPPGGSCKIFRRKDLAIVGSQNIEPVGVRGKILSGKDLLDWQANITGNIYHLSDHVNTSCEEMYSSRMG